MCVIASIAPTICRCQGVGLGRKRVGREGGRGETYDVPNERSRNNVYRINSQPHKRQPLRLALLDTPPERGIHSVDIRIRLPLPFVRVLRLGMLLGEEGPGKPLADVLALDLGERRAVEPATDEVFWLVDGG